MSIRVPENTPNGGKVIDLTAIINRNNRPKRNSHQITGYTLIPKEIIGHHFNHRRSLGEGLYAVRLYMDNNKRYNLMNGVVCESATGDVETARAHQTTLTNSLSYFYEQVKDKVVAPSDIEIKEDGHMSFIAVKCALGIMVAGWYNTESANSTNGLHMLAFTLYALGIANIDRDLALRQSTVNYLPSTKGLPPFDPSEIDAELYKAYTEN